MTNQPDITVNNRKIAQGNETFLVAEMACAHQGKLELALKIVEAASDAQADAIQLQLFNVENLVSIKSVNYEQAKELEISFDDWKIIFDAVKKTEMDLWINAFDERSVSFAAENGASLIKIHSTDLSNPHMLKAAIQTTLPISLAIGGSTQDEVEYALDYLRGEGCENIILMHGYQAFPTPVEENNLSFIKNLSEKYNVPVGFQDHAAGDSLEAMWLPIMATGMGACLIEKHLTYDEGLTDIDYQSSLSPMRFKDFRESLKSSYKAFGEKSFKPLSEKEIGYRTRMKKYVVAKTDIKVGDIYSYDNLIAVRTDTPGLSAKEVDNLVGSPAKQSYERGSLIEESEIL